MLFRISKLYWLGILNTFRTNYYSNIIELMPEINNIKETFALVS